MGGGDFGSNGSVWWSVRHTVVDLDKQETTPASHTGKDPLRYEDIGKAGGRDDGTFQFETCYPDDAAAQAARDQSTIAGGVLTIKVARTYPKRDNPGDNGPWEIKIDWVTSEQEVAKWVAATSAAMAACGGTSGTHWPTPVRPKHGSPQARTPSDTKTSVR